MKKVKLIAAFLFLAGFMTLQAQQTIPATGGEAAGSGGTTSYSAGQIGYTTYAGTNGSVALGVHQPFEISVVTGIDEAKEITLKCTVYPNPATDCLTLHAENYSTGNLMYLLSDISGKSLESKKISGVETTFSMKSFQSGIYFLKVTDNNKEVKTFKIIKK